MPDELQQRIEEAPDQPFRLGRHVNHDLRSVDFPFPVPDDATAIISVRHQPMLGMVASTTSMPLDQGQVGSCTANALCGALNLKPDFHTNALGEYPLPKTEADALRLYGLETTMEGQPYPPNDPGGSGLMVCKAAKQLGLIRSYAHAFGLTHALKALVQRPVITGVNWYDSMFNPDPATGLVSIPKQASVAGGHEIVADEIDVPGQRVGFWNSWGPGWGLGGRFYMSYATWERLLGEQGDVTVPLP